jgi:hypothetical protein
LREEGAVAGVPVILTTTADYRADAAHDLTPPVVRVLAKPFMLTTLLETVRAALAAGERMEPFRRDRIPIGSELFIG